MVKSMYIHIPFCLTRCHYCDFISYTGIDKDQKEEYVACVVKEIASYQTTSKIDTIYLGGGTPSLLSINALEHILTKIFYSFPIAEHIEITMEVNPGTIESSSLSALMDLGINRLSIGIQSLNNDILKKLGRIHTAEQSLKFLTNVLNRGVSNVNVDLMFGVPGQSMRQWISTLEKVIQTGVHHISIYNLTLMEKTPMHRKVKNGKWRMPSHETQARMYLEAIDLLEKHGLCQYEVANFSRPGYECRHNQKYWCLEDFIGIGAGAHGFLNNTHYANKSDLYQYIEAVTTRGHGISYKEPLSPKVAAFEMIMLGLRTIKGVDISAVKKRWGIDIIKCHKKTIEKWSVKEMLLIEDGFLRPTKKGILFADHMAVDFLQD